MVVVAFLVPLGLYLLVLGWLNRQPRPVVVSGTWDFVGVLFAASGFVLVGGPAVLTSVNDRWRALWLLGQTGAVTEGLDGARQWYALAAGGYFVAVVVASAWGLMARRGTTAVYNVEPGVVENEIEEACDDLGLAAERTGAVFVFRDEKTELQVETFAAMRHATLRWDAAGAAVRPAVEAELDRRLGRVGAAYHEAGAWLTLLGTAMLGISALAALALVLRAVYTR